MRFWDSSAIVPLCVQEEHTEQMRSLLVNNDLGAVWWATSVECWSAFARLEREGCLDTRGERTAREQLDAVTRRWPEVLCNDDLMRQAGLLLRRHPLRAADALQLSAALYFFGRAGGEFVTLDARLATAAEKEGLSPIPRL